MPFLKTRQQKLTREVNLETIVRKFCSSNIDLSITINNERFEAKANFVDKQINCTEFEIEKNTNGFTKAIRKQILDIKRHFLNDHLKRLYKKRLVSMQYKGSCLPNFSFLVLNFDSIEQLCDVTYITVKQ